jgi:SNF2 family DNA or RNA helicase
MMSNDVWRLSGDDGLVFNEEIVSKDLVLKALSVSNGVAIRSDLPEIRFLKNSPLTGAVLLYGTFPDDIHLGTGVLKNGAFHTRLLDADHTLIDCSWHPLEAESILAINHAFEHLELDQGLISSNDYFSLLATPELNSILQNTVEKVGNWKLHEETPLPPSPKLEATLYPYQLAGSTRLRRLAANNLGCLLGDEMGLGKTIQVIALMLDFATDTNKLVVAPSSLLINWREEIKKFAPSLTTLIHSGPYRTGIASGLIHHDVVLTSYETLVNDLTFFDDVYWDLAVLDEAQQIRNSESRRANAVKNLPRSISVAVTGTPVENSLSDLWSISEFILPELLGLKESFEDMFPDSDSAALHLGEVVAPIVIRRLVADVAQDLPDKVEILVPLELDSVDRARYSHIEASGTAFATNTARRVLCAHAENTEVASAFYFSDRPKALRVSALVNEIYEQDEKVLIFTSFRRSLHRLLQEISLLNPSMPTYVGIIDGSTSSEDRFERIEEFENHSGPGCLLLNPKAGGVGLNITSANHVIHFNPEYNPATTKQATARAFRRGQEKPVFVHHLFYQGTVEEKAISIQDFKQGLADNTDEGINNEQ